MFQKVFTRIFLVVLSAGFMASCAVKDLTVRVNSFQADGFNPGNYKTYNWYQAEPAEPASIKAPYNNQLAAHIRQSVETEMQKRGYTKSIQNPDLLLAFDVSQPRTAGATNTYSYMLGYRYSYTGNRISGYRPVGQYPANSLFIDIIHPEDNELLWRGYSENVIENYNLQRGTVENLVDDILDKFSKTQ